MQRKPIQSLKEDFQALGLIRDDKVNNASVDSQEDLSEAKVVRKKTGTDAKRAAKRRKIEYKKNKAKKLRAAAKYRKSAVGKRKISKHYQLVQRMGGTKPGAMIRTSSVERNANLIEELGKLNNALHEGKEAVNSQTMSESDVSELRKSIRNTHRLATIMAKRLAEYIEAHGHKIPRSLLAKHFAEAAIDPNSDQWENPEINPEKPTDKEIVGKDQPEKVSDEHDVDSVDQEAKKNVGEAKGPKPKKPIKPTK
jgi:hypothetical protein